MRIALYDPEPVCGGPCSWTRHTQTGLRALGHECDVVSFTKSGRPRKAWGQFAPGTSWYDRPVDVTGKYADCRAVLSKYDGVVLTEPLIGLQDREALKNGWQMPYYARVLDVAQVKFTTALQAFSYSLKAAPFAGFLVSLPSFAGRGITHVKPSMVLRDNAPLRDIEWVMVPHPYTMHNADDAQVPYRGVAGCAGRFVHINAFHILALAAAYGTLPDDTTVQLRGACAVSNRASFSMEVYEALRDKFGYEGERSGEDVFRHHDWWLRKPGSIVRYDGAYYGWPDSVRTCSAFQSYVSVLSDENSHGASSYTQLEAIDAGCMQVATTYHWRDEFRGEVIPALPTMPSLGTVVKDQSIQRWVLKAGEAVSRSLAIDDATRNDIARHNREVVREEHDPRLTAKLIVEVLS